MRGESSRRVERINELLRDEISDLIRRELKDPRLAGLITVTEVQTAPDLYTARVFISVLGNEDDRKAALTALRNATGFFHRQLFPRLRLRRVPTLDFRYDTSLERGDRVINLLRQISNQQSETAASTGEDTEEQGKPPREE